jgi:hypothetical protein
MFCNHTGTTRICGHFSVPEGQARGLNKMARFHHLWNLPTACNASPLASSVLKITDTRILAFTEGVTKGLKHTAQCHISIHFSPTKTDTSVCSECSPGESFDNTWHLSIKTCYIQHAGVIGTSHSKEWNSQTTGHQPKGQNKDMKPTVRLVEGGKTPSTRRVRTLTFIIHYHI